MNNLILNQLDEIYYYINLNFNEELLQKSFYEYNFLYFQSNNLEFLKII